MPSLPISGAWRIAFQLQRPRVVRTRSATIPAIRGFPRQPWEISGAGRLMTPTYSRWAASSLNAKSGPIAMLHNVT
jgi:hypothetical protein